MKRILTIATVVVILGVVSVAAQSNNFNSNLQIGSKGADVIALQTWLIQNGYHIPAIESSAAMKGTFGSQTKTAVMKYQTVMGLPSTGFVGPLTRGKLNSTATVSSSASSSAIDLSAGCPTGFTCTAIGSVFPSGLPAGITTPGVAGIMTVSQGPLSSAILHPGDIEVPVLTVRIQAQYSDIDFNGLVLDLGTNSAIYNKIFSKMYITADNNVLFSSPLDTSSVVTVQTQYVFGTAGYDYIIPKGTYKDIVIKADVRPSIDSTYRNQSPWYISVDSLAVSSLDGAGVILYGPATDGLIVQGLTINPSLIDNAQANVSLSSDSPLVASIPVTDTTNGQYLGLPVLKFDVNAQNDSLHLRTVVAKIYTLSGSTGSIGAAYLFNGTTQIASASVSGNTATFSNITNGTAGASVPRDTTGHFTIKVDATGVTSGTLGVRAGVATSTSADLTILSSNDSTVTVSGSAQGNTQTVASVGPLFTLVGTPTIAKSTISDQNGVNSTSTYTATFNVNVQAVGAAVNFGLLSSSTPSFATSTTRFDVYKNGTLDSMTNYTSNGNSVISGYAQPTGTSLSSDSTYFTLGQNQSVTIPVTYSWVVRNASNNQYAGQLQGIQWYTTSAAGPTTFMLNQPLWRTGNI